MDNVSNTFLTRTVRPLVTKVQRRLLQGESAEEIAQWLKNETVHMNRKEKVELLGYVHGISLSVELALEMW